MNAPFCREVQGVGARHLPDGDTGQGLITNKLSNLIVNISLQIGYASRPLHHRCIGRYFRCEDEMNLPGYSMRVFKDLQGRIAAPDHRDVFTLHE